MSYYFSCIYMEHSYCMFLPDNEVRERRNVVQFLTFLKFLKIFLRTQIFIAIWSQRDKIQQQRISLILL